MKADTGDLQLQALGQINTAMLQLLHNRPQVPGPYMPCQCKEVSAGHRFTGQILGQWTVSLECVAALARSNYVAG